MRNYSDSDQDYADEIFDRQAQKRWEDTADETEEEREERRENIETEVPQTWAA